MAFDKSITLTRGCSVSTLNISVWWGDMPMPLYTLIEKHNWQGKTVVPFCTHEGSGLGSTESKLKEACEGATVLRLGYTWCHSAELTG